MKANPPAPADAPELAKFARIGTRSGPGLRCKQAQRGLRQADSGGRLRPDHAAVQGQPRRQGHQWLGLHDEDGRLRHRLSDARRIITAIGLGANRPQDAIYPTSLKDADDNDYDGANRYVVHFADGDLPPAEGFWSITMYDANYFFVANPINRYSISERQHLKRNADGSVDLYVQKESPGAGQAGQLAARPSGQIHPDDAALLAK